MDLAVQRIVFQPGGQSGWHTQEAVRTARLAGVYAPAFATRASLGGTTQNLPDGEARH